MRMILISQCSGTPVNLLPTQNDWVGYLLFSLPGKNIFAITFAWAKVLNWFTQEFTGEFL